MSQVDYVSSRAPARAKRSMSKLHLPVAGGRRLSNDLAEAREGVVTVHGLEFTVKHLREA